ncbi:homoserine kinase [Conexibacter sp. DBS9H8]|uniref:homoserine kinase n=1 Tax=Conexibacter sp. DBS9H8 TaxID=2937801 RepID=UPI00200DAA3C|nr:homoserine kinase [Conexibacter sp. DBS9H8]
MTLARRRLVRVPASSANLGPGFDVMAAALGLGLEVEVAETGRFGVHTDLPVRTDRDNLTVRGFEALHPADDFSFTVRSAIPLSGGLGSSAAAVLAGAMAADHIFELDADLLAVAAAIEGHVDNAAAALHGGVVIASAGRVDRLDAPLGLEAVLVIPHRAVATAAARAALTPDVPRADAVHNLAALARLTLGLARADFELIAAGLADRIHQPARASLYPQSTELVARATDLGALGATISGAGPTVLVWTTVETTGFVYDALRRDVSDWARVLRAPFESQGAYVTAL